MCVTDKKKDVTWMSRWTNVDAEMYPPQQLDLDMVL